jgi:hypothetical protein
LRQRSSINTFRSSRGTGRYTRKIGTFEEDGDLNSGAIYGKLLKTGEKLPLHRSFADPEYDPKKGSLLKFAAQSGWKIKSSV